jgi:hypothetical protein
LKAHFAIMWHYHLLPIFGYTALACLMTLPMVQQFTTAVPGNGYDSWQNMWNMWWLKQAILEGHNPFYTTEIYYPDGTSLLLHTLNPFNFLISLPVQAIGGLVAAYNTVIIFSLASSGYAAYLLARDVTDDWGAALLSGIVFACSAYLLAQVMGGHMNLVAAEWLPFAVLTMRWAARSPGLRTILLAALCLFLNVLCDWQYFLFAVMWGCWYALALVWQQRTIRASVPVVLTLVVSSLLVLPLLIPTAALAMNTPHADTGDEHRLGNSADVADFIIPLQLHPLWGDLAQQAQAYKAETHIQNKTAYLGTVTLLLALAGIRRREGQFWLLSALLFGVLALGPQLHIAGYRTSIPLPASLIYEIPFVRISRFPIRFVVLVMLALAVLVALGARALLATLSQYSRHPIVMSRIALMVLAGLLVLDNLPLPFPMVGIDIPPVYAEMGQDEEEYAVLESPFYWRTSAVYMLYQVVHEKPLVGGYISRQQPYPFLERFPIVQAFAYARITPDISGQDYAEIAPSVFSYFNIRYLILHSDGGALRDERLIQLAQAAAGGAEPERITIPLRTFLIYRTATPNEPVPFLGFGSGWSPPQLRPHDRPSNNSGTKTDDKEISHKVRW